MIKKRYILINGFIIVLGLMITFYSLAYFNIFLLIFGIIVFLSGVLTLTFMASYSLFTQEEDIKKTLEENDGLHLAICDECGKENILEDVYCVRCGNKLEN